MSQNSNTRPMAFQPPDSSFRIRPVRLDDIEALRADCWAHRTPARCRDVIRRIQYAQRHGRGLGVIALHPEDETRIIAYGQIMQWTKCAEISDLIVAETHRGQGIGTALIQYLIGHLALSPRPCIEIGVAESNPRARALYRRLGFKDAYTLDLHTGSGQERIIYLQIAPMDP